MSFLQQAEFVNGTATDWTHLGSTAHAVQFYEHDDSLAGLLAAYVGTAVVKGDCAIVVATQKHRDDLRASLARRGLDLGVAERQGRYEGLDAEETLAMICPADGWPDRQLFTRVVGEMLTRVTRNATDRARVAAFGEMVALLSARGQFAAAVRLEELWNDLARSYSFSLCCAYPMNLFKADDVAAARFMKVCAQHSHVFPAERRSAGSRSRSRTAFG